VGALGGWVISYERGIPVGLQHCLRESEIMRQIPT